MDHHKEEDLSVVPDSKRTSVPHLSFIVHSHLRWDFVWQRPQQILSRLALRYPVLFVEDAIAEERSVGLEITEPHPNIFRVVPRFARGSSHNDHDMNDSFYEQTLSHLRRAIRHHPALRDRFDTPVQWFYSPMSAPYMLSQFNAIKTVYDCMDELANFRYAPANIVERERLLLTKANIVFTGGYQLYRSKSHYNANVHFYGCGVDVAHFRRARQASTALPAELASLPRPIFGYFGVIDERIDYELLRHLASALPHASLVMVGPIVKVDTNSLPRLPNIHWLGQRAYDELPALVKSFDVCLMPFALNDATRYINPTKTLEYMAAGKPIVSTAVPDVVHNFTPIVAIAHSPSEFAQAVQRASEAPDAQLIKLGIQKANQESWESIVDSMHQHITNSISTDRQRGAVPNEMGMLNGINENTELA